MARKVMDCREYPNEAGCTLTIVGEEDEVIRAAAEHAVSIHGETDSPELRHQLRRLLKDEGATPHARRDPAAASERGARH